MSSIYERQVTKSWTEYTIKVRSLSIGELQLLARWLIDKVGEERAEIANAVTFEVRGDDDEAELVALVERSSAAPESSLDMVSMHEVLEEARVTHGMYVNSSQAKTMLARIWRALPMPMPMPDERNEGPFETVTLLGVPLLDGPSVGWDCVYVGHRIYLLTEGSTHAIRLPGALRLRGRVDGFV